MPHISLNMLVFYHAYNSSQVQKYICHLFPCQYCYLNNNIFFIVLKVIEDVVCYIYKKVLNWSQDISVVTEVLRDVFQGMFQEISCKEVC